MAEFVRLTACVVSLAALAGCGKTGDLYLPGEHTEVVTRPAPSPAPAPPESSNSPQTPPSPAPEVTAPAPDAGRDDERARKDGSTAEPPR